MVRRRRCAIIMFKRRVAMVQRASPTVTLRDVSTTFSRPMEAVSPFRRRLLHSCTTCLTRFFNSWSPVRSRSLIKRRIKIRNLKFFLDDEVLVVVVAGATFAVVGIGFCTKDGEVVPRCDDSKGCWQASASAAELRRRWFCSRMMEAPSKLNKDEYSGRLKVVVEVWVCGNAAASKDPCKEELIGLKADEAGSMVNVGGKIQFRTICMSEIQCSLRFAFVYFVRAISTQVLIGNRKYAHLH